MSIRRDGAVEGEMCQFRRKENEPGTSSFGIQLPTGSAWCPSKAVAAQNTHLKDCFLIKTLFFKAAQGSQQN